MSTTAWPALGTTLGIDEAWPPGGTYTLIGQITSLSNLGGGEMGKRDTTNLASSVKSYFPTIPDNGEVSMEINFDPTDAVHIFLFELKDVPPTGSTASYSGFNNFKATFSTAASTHTKVFPAFVSSIDGGNAGGVDENLTATVNLQVVGAVVTT